MAYQQEQFQVPPVPPKLSNAKTFNDLKEGVQQYAQQNTKYLADFENEIRNNQNNNTQGLGPNILSNTTIYTSRPCHLVTGTAAVQTIIPPAKFSSQLMLFAGTQPGFSLEPGGNIYLNQAVPVTSFAILNYQPQLPELGQAPTGPGGWWLTTNVAGSGNLSFVGINTLGVTGSFSGTSAPNDAVLIGNGDDPVASVALSSGQLLIGTASTPSAATPTGTANQVTVTAGSGSLSVSLPATITGPTRITGLNAPTAANDALSEGNPIGAIVQNTIGFTAATGQNVQAYQNAGQPNTIVYTASMTPNLALGDTVLINATNGSAFTIQNPTNPLSYQRWLLSLTNTSGGSLGTVSWGGAFVNLDTVTSPANGKRRFFEFLWNGTSHYMMWESPFDIG